MYIRRIANHLHREQGMPISRAVAVAVNTVKRWAAGGTVREGGGARVTPKTQAQAAAALAQWNAKKARGGSNRATNLSRDMLPDVTAQIDLAGRWKHGWIPLDPVAIRIKAKGNRSTTALYQKRFAGMSTSERAKVGRALATEKARRTSVTPTTNKSVVDRLADRPRSDASTMRERAQQQSVRMLPDNVLDAFVSGKVSKMGRHRAAYDLDKETWKRLAAAEKARRQKSDLPNTGAKSPLSRMKAGDATGAMKALGENQRTGSKPTPQNNQSKAPPATGPAGPASFESTKVTNGSIRPSGRRFKATSDKDGRSEFFNTPREAQDWLNSRANDANKREDAIKQMGANRRGLDKSVRTSPSVEELRAELQRRQRKVETTTSGSRERRNAQKALDSFTTQHPAVAREARDAKGDRRRTAETNVRARQAGAVEQRRALEASVVAKLNGMSQTQLAALVRDSTQPAKIREAAKALLERRRKTYQAGGW